MSILAGIFSRDEAHSVDDAACEDLRRVISRNPQDDVVVFRNPRLFVAKVDIGAYKEPAFHVDPSGAISVLAGEPLIMEDEAESGRTREVDLQRLHLEWNADKWDLLRLATGVFCGVHYKPEAAKLTLLTDKLGLRCLYYWEGDRFVVFATALRILENCGIVTKQIDVRGVTEIACLTFPLADRSPYANIRMLRAAEVVQVTAEKVGRAQYWRWDTVPPSQMSEADQVTEMYTRFQSAVTRRLRGDRTTAAFLSGGLDSRSIVSMLRILGANVHTFTFMEEGSQDQVFASEFAHRIATFHEAIPTLPPSEESLGRVFMDAWKVSKARLTWPAERPQLAWSGDGGSTGLGHFHMWQEIVELQRAGQVDAAIDFHLGKVGVAVSAKLISSRLGQDIQHVVHDGVKEELQDIHHHDPARAFHIFLMINDQRRHLGEHLADLDLHQLELHVPFFDSSVVEFMLSLPLDACLYHRFYSKWLASFPPVVTSVPWQAYPGHEPCKLPIRKGGVYQWSKKWSPLRRRAHRQRILQRARQMLSADAFPNEIINRRVLRAATFLYRFGLRDCDYLITAASTYYKYWKKCHGKNLTG